MSKKILSIVLALVMVLAMGTVALVSVSADLATLPEQPENTYRYYFYMPKKWLNASTETTGNTAGVYWWEGTDACGGWPGYQANAADVEGVYYYDVPTDVTTIIWNNFFDGGADIYAPYYKDAVQTRNIGTEYYDPGESDLYPEGTENFDGMIYVTDLAQVDYNDYSGKMQFGGEWFYYYGNGEYGTSKVKGESEVRTDALLNSHLPWPDEEPPVPTTTVGGDVVPTTTVEAEPVVTTTTQAAPVEPEQPAGCTTDITFAGTEVKSACVGDKITYTMDLTAARLFENIQAVITYDSTVLKLERVLSDDPDIADWEVEGPVRCPNLEGVIFNAGTDGLVKFNASKVAGYNFKNEAKNLVNLEFTVIAEGAATISTVIEEMTIKGDGTESYFTGGQAVITDGITITEDLQVPDHPVPTTTTEEKTTVTVEKTTATAEKTTVTVDQPATDPTNEVGTTATGTVVTPPTGAAAYIYIAIAIMAMAACAVVVLRKKAND